MKKILLITFILALTLGIFNIHPAFAETTKFTLKVINQTNDTLVIYLVGEVEDESDEYKLEVDRFSTSEKDFPKNTYSYEYDYCGTTVAGTLKLKNDVEWVIYPCGVEPTKMRINSHLADKTTVTMYGPLELPEPEEEEFVVELGGNRIQDILSGHYLISYEAACSTVGTDPATVFSDEIRVLKSGKTQVTLHGCEWYTAPARTYDKPVPVKFKIVNYASFPLVLQLVGPEGALLDINPGINLVELIYGTYKFGYFLDYEYHTGYMMVTKNGLGQLNLKPSHIYALPDSLSEDDSGE
ncbi:hypothetical protein ACFLXI_06150 [Chloroflexota bacterium]